MKATKIIFGLIIFGVFIYLFFNIFVGEKDKTLCGDNGLISNFNLSGVVPSDFCNNSEVESSKKIILIESTTVSIEIASSSGDMMRGLSGRTNLKDDEGMLFVFNNMGSHGFWMKDMNFSIDIIFINENFEVVGIEKSVATSTYPELFGEEFVSRYVLEVQAGFSDRNGIKFGDEVIF